MGTYSDFVTKYLPECELFIVNTHTDKLNKLIWRLDPTIRKKIKCTKKFKKLSSLKTKKCRNKVKQNLIKAVEKKGDECKGLLSPIIIDVCNKLGYQVLHKGKQLVIDKNNQNKNERSISGFNKKSQRTRK